MMRFITPIILIAIAITTFFVFTNPIYQEILQKRADSASYNEALNNSKALENERDKLTTKYNTILPDNLVKIKKLLPDNIDNIRLILEIGQIALPYGMILKNVQYDTLKEDATAHAVSGGQSSSAIAALHKDYGVWDLSFSITGTYVNFLNFLKDLESNLRIVDISSITFDSTNVSATPGSVSSLQDMYTYNFKIKTYWLKN